MDGDTPPVILDGLGGLQVSVNNNPDLLANAGDVAHSMGVLSPAGGKRAAGSVLLDRGLATRPAIALMRLPY